MDTGKQIFREKSLKRVASPEELDDYIRVTNPGVWLLLTCIIVFLVGLCIWGYFGQIRSTTPMYGIADNGAFTGYVTGETFLKLKEGMLVQEDDETGEITDLSPYPAPAYMVCTEVQMDKLGVTTETPLYPVQSDIFLEDGPHAVDIVLEEIKPFQLIFD